MSYYSPHTPPNSRRVTITTPRNSNAVPRRSKADLSQMRRHFRFDPRISFDAQPQLVKQSSRKGRQTIVNYLLHRNVPAWYRGMSSFQRSACDQLHEALRDDREQNTTHRLEDCLCTIGLKPGVSSPEIMKLIHLSRSSDLAFLYFLLELHYKTPGPTYTVNEQLIMSSISYLDLIPTLRELDRILPPEQPPKKELLRRQRLWQQFLDESMKRHADQSGRCRRYPPSKAKAKFAPYFQAYTKPKLSGKPLWIGDPDFQVSENVYGSYKDDKPIKNESTRWFANYQLDPSQRIAKRILKEEIADIVGNFEACDVDRETVDSMCAHHKVIEDLKKSLALELQEIANQRCHKHFDVVSKDKEAIRTRVHERLDKDMKQYITEFDKMANTSRKQTLMKILSQHSVRNVELDHNCNPIKGCLKKHNSVDFECDPDVRIQQVCVDNVDVTVIEDEQVAQKKPFKLLPPASHDSQCMGDSARWPHSSDSEECEFRPQCGRCTSTDSGIGDYYNYGHSTECSPTPSQTYFEAPSEHKPLKFNYRKIFAIKTNTPAVLNIKKAFIEAIDNDVDQLNSLHDSELDLGRTVGEAAHKLWADNVKQRKAEMDAEKERDKPNEDAIFNYKQDYYDPNDHELMLQMLKDAFDYMKKNRHFVLPTLPDAHKTPNLLHFLCQRFGRRYTKAEKLAYLKQSGSVFKAIDATAMKVRVPPSYQLGLNTIVPYTCRDYITKKAAAIKRKYYGKIDDCVMRHTREFWFAMRPFLCSNGPPRNTYFAYMPSRVNHIQHFNLWKTNEFKPYAQFWLKRNSEELRRQY